MRENWNFQEMSAFSSIHGSEKLWFRYFFKHLHNLATYILQIIEYTILSTFVVKAQYKMARKKSKSVSGSPAPSRKQPPIELPIIEQPSIELPTIEPPTIAEPPSRTLSLSDIRIGLLDEDWNGTAMGRRGSVSLDPIPPPRSLAKRIKKTFEGMGSSVKNLFRRSKNKLNEMSECKPFDPLKYGNQKDDDDEDMVPPPKLLQSQLNVHNFDAFLVQEGCV